MMEGTIKNESCKQMIKNINEQFLVGAEEWIRLFLNDKHYCEEFK